MNPQPKEKVMDTDEITDETVDETEGSGGGLVVAAALAAGAGIALGARRLVKTVKDRRRSKFEGPLTEE
jgi:hypothetical protein